MRDTSHASPSVFILPLDFIPDMLGPLGYSDDMAALAMALQTIWHNITPEVKKQALDTLSDWFDEISPDDLKLFD